MRHNPPQWAKDAIATERGWVDPKTGELLIAVAGLLDAEVKEHVPTVEKKKKKKE